MTARSLAGSLVVLLGFFVSASAHAGDTDDLLGILNESVVTTASHTAETASTAPATSTTISADDLRRYGIHTVEEAIDFLGLGISSGGGRNVLSVSELGSRGVFITGTVGHHILLLIDGHAVNEPYYGTARFDHTAGIPLEAIDHIEVIVGPGSVLYGSSAMSGVVNIITKDASALEGGRVVAETELPVYRRAAALGGARFTLFGLDAELTGAAQYWEEYGPDFTIGPQNLGIDTITERPTRSGRGRPEDGVWGGTADDASYAQIPGGLARLKVGDVTLSLRGRIAKWGRPFIPSDFDDPESYVIERNVSADLAYRALLTPKLRLSTRLYGDLYDNVDYNDLSAAAACPYPGVVTCRYAIVAASRWAGTEVQAGYDWLGTGELDTLFGFDGRVRFAGAKQDITDFDTGEYLDDSRGVVDETDQTFGAYVQQTYSPTSALGFNAGARLDYDPRFSPVVSPRAAASFGLWDGGTLRTIYSQAFRAPTYEETHSGNLIRARAEDLEPETVRSVEGSFEQRFGAHRVLFGVFRTWWQDLVESRFLTNEEALDAARRGLLPIAIENVSFAQYRNAASVDSYGFNVALDGTIFSQSLRYGVNVTEAFTRKEDPAEGSQPLPVAPRLAANARVAYDLGDPLPTLALASRLLSSRLADRALTAGFEPTPVAPTQLELRLTATGNVPMIEGLSYRISGDYLSGNRGPYAIGPTLVATPVQPTAELSPLPEYRATFGLEYRFLDR